MLHCTHCDYACLGQDLLDKHLKQRHGHIGRNGRHKCDWCEYSTDDKSSLTRHQGTHSWERPFSCDDCDKAFSVQYDLTVHRRRAHGGPRPYMCDICGKAFTQKSQLAVHTRVHTGEMVRQCEQCGARFNQASNYIVHMRSHDGVKAYQCQVCPARFVSRQHLKIHVRTHTGERPYGCSFCPARFPQHSAMRRHVITHHTHDFRHWCGRCGKGFYAPIERRRHEAKCTLTDALLICQSD